MSDIIDKRGIGGLNIDETELNSGSLGLFSPLIAEGNILGNYTQILRPLTCFDSAGPFEFVFPATDSEYVDLTSFKMLGSFKIEKDEGAAAPAAAPAQGADADADGGNAGNQAGAAQAAAADCSVVNLAPYSLFKLLEVSLNGTSVEDVGTPLHGVKCFLETYLSHDKSATNTHLRSRFFIPDDQVDYADNAKVETRPNAAYALRQNFVGTNTTLYFNAPIHASLFATGSRYLLPGVNVKMKFTRNNDAFTILANTDSKSEYRILIDDLRVSVKRIKVSKSVLDTHSARLLKQPAIMPFHMAEMKTIVIPSGVSSFVAQNAIVGELPHTILFGLAEATVLDGTPKTNPFAFKPNGLIGVHAIVNGTMVPSTPYEMDFSKNKFWEPYLDLLKTCGGGVGNATVYITPEIYKTNLCLFGIDLSGDGCSGYHQHVPERTGSIDLHLKFGAATTNALKIVIYTSRHAAIAINDKREVVFVDPLGSFKIAK